MNPEKLSELADEIEDLLNQPQNKATIEKLFARKAHKVGIVKSTTTSGLPCVAIKLQGTWKQTYVEIVVCTECSVRIKVSANYPEVKEFLSKILPNLHIKGRCTNLEVIWE